MLCVTRSVRGEIDFSFLFPTADKGQSNHEQVPLVKRIIMFTKQQRGESTRVSRSNTHRVQGGRKRNGVLPSGFALNDLSSPLLPFPSFLSWRGSPRPTAFLLDQSYLGKQATAALCVCVCASCCLLVVVSLHMLALTCWWAGL